MKKIALICAILLSIPTISMAYSSVDSPFYENAVWKERKLTNQEVQEAIRFFKVRIDESVDEMSDIPTWNGMGSNQAFDRHIELKERYTCNFELVLYEMLVFLKSQMVYHPSLKQDHKKIQTLFTEMVSGKDPDTYTVAECKSSDNWFPM